MLRKVGLALGALALLVLVAALGVGTAYSGRQTVRHGVTLAKKPAEVFENLTRFADLVEMGTGVKEVKLPPDGAKPAIGYKFELETEAGPAAAEITKYEEGRELAFRVAVRGHHVGEVEFTIDAAEGGGSEIAVQVHVDGSPPFGGLYNLAARRAIDAAIASSSAQLKAQLESGK